MNEFLDPSVIVAIAASASAIIGAILLKWKWSERHLKVRICKFREPNTNPQIWKIRINYWNKPIENCNVLIDDEPLLWDKTNTEYYSLEAPFHRGNLSIPTKLFKEDAKVTVKSNNKHIVTEKLSNIKPCEG